VAARQAPDVIVVRKDECGKTHHLGSSRTQTITGARCAAPEGAAMAVLRHLSSVS
jgi:hypothetical protein